MKQYIALTIATIIHIWSSSSQVPTCSFTQFCVREQGQSIKDPCPDSKNAYTPFAEKSAPRYPLNGRKYLLEACPNLVDKEVCWNDDQILLMYNNFKTVDSLFGNWLLWSINLKRFWCEFTCSPYQYYFVDAFEQIKVKDVDYPVLNLTMRISNDLACDIFYSCKKNPYVATLASGQSAAGFLEFMGSNAVQTGKVKISFDFTSDPDRSLIKEMYPWDKQVNGTIENYEVEPWTCNYCEAAWKPSAVKAYPAFFDGFDFVVVIIVYITLILLSVIIYFVKKRWMKSDPSDSILISHDENDEGCSSKRSNNFSNLLDSNDPFSHKSLSDARINKSDVKSFGIK